MGENPAPGVSPTMCCRPSIETPEEKDTRRSREERNFGAFHNEWEPRLGHIEALCLPVKDAVCQLQEKRETVPDVPGTSGWYVV